jgi:hypothetical protein
MSLYLREDLSKRESLTEPEIKNMTQLYLKAKISEPITSVHIASNLAE